MPDTDYHGQTMPTVDGSVDTWGQLLNTLIQYYDGVIELRGTLNDRPSAANVPNGAKYVVTSGSEAGTIYIESGDAWVDLGTLSSGSGTIGTGDLADEAVTEPKVDFTNSPTGGQVVTWNATAGRFEWGSVTGLSNPLTQDLDAAGFDIENVNRLTMNIDNQNQLARDGRPLYTVDEVTYYVNATDGDDTVATADITSTNQLKTLQEALDRIPWIIQHETTIQLQGPDTYGATGSTSTGPLFLSGFNRTGAKPAFILQGDQANPTDVVLNMNLNLPVFTAEIDDHPDAVINSLQTNGGIANKGGQMSLANVDFVGGFDNAYGIEAYGGKVNVWDCTFSKPVEWAIKADYHSDIYVSGCSGQVADVAYLARIGATIRAGGDTKNSITGDNGVHDLYHTAQLIRQDGDVVTSNLGISDDWDDGRWRHARASDHTLVRPRWKDVAGSNDISVEAGMLQLPAGSGSSRLVDADPVGHPDAWQNITDELVVDWEWQSDPTTGAANVYVMRVNGNDYWRGRIANDGNVHLDKEAGGVFAGGLITDTGHDDTNLHTLRITRSSAGGWDLYVDDLDTAAGSVSDTFVPPHTSPWAFRFENLADADIRFDNLMLRTASSN